MLRAVVLTQYRLVADGRTDRQTDGIAVASIIALAMRALRSVAKRTKNFDDRPHCRGDFYGRPME